MSIFAVTPPPERTHGQGLGRTGVILPAQPAFRQLGEVHRQPPRLVLSEQLGRRAPTGSSSK